MNTALINHHYQLFIHIKCLTIIGCEWMGNIDVNITLHGEPVNYHESGSLLTIINQH